MAYLQQCGYQQLTSLSASTALTVPVNASAAIVTPETQAVRWRNDGTSPTASVGNPIAVAVSVTFNTRNDLLALKFIEQTSAAKLNVAYYG